MYTVSHQVVHQRVMIVVTAVLSRRRRVVTSGITPPYLTSNVVSLILVGNPECQEHPYRRCSW